MAGFSDETIWHILQYISARTQPIIVNATADMLKDHILPVAEKLKEHARKMEVQEEQFNQEKRHRNEQGEAEEVIHEVSTCYIQYYIKFKAKRKGIIWF